MSVAIHTARERRQDELSPCTFAGNWRKREAFAWSEQCRPDDAEAFGLFMLRHRDSRLVEQSNGRVIRRELTRFVESGDVEFHRFGHFGYGWAEEVAVRVYRPGTTDPTDAFQTLARLNERQQATVIIDEIDYSTLEYEAALESFSTALIGSGVDRSALPDGWQVQVYNWLRDSDERQLENVDDQGASPSQEAVIEALTALCLISPIEG
jgi:hypothetical protein